MKKLFSYVVLLSFTSIMAHNGYADTMPTYQQRQAVLRAQGEAEIKRYHELRLERIKAEVLASRLQLQAGDVNVYNNSYASAGSEVVTETTNTNRMTTTQTNENN